MLERVFSATETRANFFNILNRVLYGDEKIFVKKAGADYVVKLERIPKTEEKFAQLIGRISDEDAKTMKNAIAKARKYPHRKTGTSRLS